MLYILAPKPNLTQLPSFPAILPPPIDSAATNHCHEFKNLDTLPPHPTLLHYW